MRTRKTGVALASFLLVVVLANAASRKNTIEIKVLDSETRSAAEDNNGVARNCEQLTFDAYCRSTSAASVVNTLVVQEGDKPPFRVSCTSTSRFSRCVPLPQGQSFEARREKRGIVVYYVDDKGKLRSQLYTLVVGAVPPAPGPAAATTVTEPAKAGVGNDESTSAATTQPSPAAPATTLSPAPAESKAPPAVGSTTSSAGDTVKCSFSSTPSGAEVTLDGKYVGSTPSVVGIKTGSHVVVISMAGFSPWKRELTVEPGSELTVSAVLQKVQ